MTGSRRRVFEPIVLGVALASYGLWTWGVMSGWLGENLDARVPTPEISPRSYLGQLAEAFSVFTSPFFVLVVALSLVVAAFQQRQRRLALALLIAAAGLPLCSVNQQLIDRPRPESAFADSLAAVGPSYPSGHLSGVTILLWIVVAIANSQRRGLGTSMRRRTLAGLLVVFTAFDQWVLGVSRPSDLVGGWLFGMVVATAVLWVIGLDSITRPWRQRRIPEPTGRRAAVIYNPTKVLELDAFRRRVTVAMVGAGWDSPLWIETERDDPGRAMARDALAKGVDLVLVAGGDGTVRTVCAELAGSGVPAAIIPAGTGNLLGRNLGIPLDEAEALEVALHGSTRPVDVVRWTVGGTDASFVVMAGVGLDAQIMRDTDPRLKRLVKGGAYVVAGARQLGAEPFHARVKVDGELVYEGEAAMTLVGNVGRLQGGIALLPAADAADGLLHVLVATGRGVTGMVRLLGALGRESRESPLRRFQGTRVEVELDREVPYEIDGDLEGSVDRFSAAVLPAELLVRAPRRRTR
ncbi:diacylglycerol kinase family protein [Demequina iriomotensis]|uniref:diacylglycerol kinase family protein n=1 Tax=Demequina iriomotensis TaxID=1536641 RepID=UPI000786375F|nr:diacylglycerol kinase family protein [Demequina iriomotensis]